MSAGVNSNNGYYAGGYLRGSVSDHSRISLHYQRTENEVDFARPQRTITAFNEREEDIFTIKWDYLWQGDDGLYVKAYYHDWDSWFTRFDNDLANPGQVITVDDHSFWGYEDYGLNAMARFSVAERMQLVAGFDHQSYSGRDDVLLIADQTESVNAAFLQVRSLEGRFPERGWPDAWQLYGNDPCCTQGNPELEGEESLNFNVVIGAELAAIGAGLSWELIGFYRTVDNLIGSSQQIPDIPELIGKLLLAYSPAGSSFGFNGSLLYVGDVYFDVGGFFPDGSFVEHGSYAVVDISGYYEFGGDGQHRVVARIENLFDEDYATSVRTATADAGGNYLYDNLGVPQTFHFFYSYRF